MKKLLSFLSYHNAVPIAGIILALGAGATFAATASGALPLGAPNALDATSTEPQAPDASYLIAADLDSYMPTAKVTGVTEDSDNYYVSYALSTIAIVGNAWQPTVENETLTISKAALGAYRDLGLYVANQLQQRTAQELAYLQRAQSVAEASAQTQSSGTEVASAYASLVGKTLDADSSVISGYTPVVENPVPTISSASPAPSPQIAPSQNPTPQTSDSSQTIDGSQSAASSTPAVTEATSSADAATSATPDTPPVIQINGDNPAVVQVGATYNDLGATITSPTADLNLGITTYVNGTEMSPVQIDTNAAATDTIDYVATDQNGLTSTSTRTVIVEVSTAADNSTATTTSSATDTATSTPSAGNDVTITPDTQSDSNQGSATTTDATSTTGE